uniref:Uncharacterized protein n=1 Tax=Tanacetum cinerariifolium TaxID=118510 RepID=A0A699JJN1_TANCI|nr:hypothetical protein [Tanacetum cinerariifolium]
MRKYSDKRTSWMTNEKHILKNCHDQKWKKMKFLQDMQLIHKLRDDQKRMKKVVEDMSRSYVQKSNQDRVWYRKLLCHPQQYVRLQAKEIKMEDSSRSRSLKTISRNAGLHSYNFTLFLLLGNIVTNSRVTQSWREIVIHPSWLSMKGVGESFIFSFSI